jgi:hypothetical protein
VPTSAVTGDIGVSPINSTAITGFSLEFDDASGQFSTSSQVLGKCFAANYGGETAADLTTAVNDMQTAYTAAAGHASTDNTRDNMGNGAIGGKTLVPGVYMFTVGVNIRSDLTFEGDADDVFIIKTTGVLSQAANTKVLLSGGAQTKNVFWQVAGNAVIGADAEMQGILLVKTNVLFETGSSLLGSILAQTAVNIQMATITQAAGTCTTTA